MTPRENAAAVTALLAEVKAHPLCLRFTDDGGYYLVIYPEGYYPDGARAAQDGGKATALRRLLAAMERHWAAG